MRSAYITILLIATAFLILVAALMALLIGLVLPRHMLDEEVHQEEQEVTEEVFFDQLRRNAHRSYGSIDDYNWLVSINFLRYRDIPTSLEFFCSGVIISRNKILTTSGCFKETFTDEDFKYATIRSHSAHFSTGGYTHSVRSVQKAKNTLNSPYNEVYLVEVKPSFSSKTNTPLLITTCGAQVALETMSEGGALVLTGWGGPRIPTEHILKYEPFFVQRWFPKEYIDCKGNMCNNQLPNVVTTCCNEAHLVESLRETSRLNARPLVAIRRLGPPLFIGMQIDSSSLSKSDQTQYFIDFGYSKFVEWLRETLPDLIVEETVHIRQNFEILTLYNKVDFETYSDERSAVDVKSKSKRSIKQCSSNMNLNNTIINKIWNCFIPD
ncbi:uncharacterized protein LOC130900470 [Diorhabda carinulata]|uniref:uncharacterized protein LOC130900470 n=1 Tax=Diorhabda carinulata TaxID=1163345 RepID=UPI0025A2246D|nr:uncharacterized protein LOC130900470 [Diorhabda carinulata]